MARGTTIGDVKVENSDSMVLSGVITGKLEVKDFASVIIDGPVYVMGEIILSGREIIPGADGGTLLSLDKITVAGLGGYDPDPLIHNDLRIISMKGDEDKVAINFSGAPLMKATFAAPNGKANLSGTAEILGRVLAKKVYVSGELKVRPNVHAAYWAGESSVKIKSWQEIHGG